MLELSAFLRLRWPIYGTVPEIKKKKKGKKELQNMVDIIHHTGKKKPIIEWEMSRIASMAALKKKRKRSWEILVNRTCKEYFLHGSFGRKTYCSLLCDRLQGNRTTKLSTFAGKFSPCHGHYE